MQPFHSGVSTFQILFTIVFCLTAGLILLFLVMLLIQRHRNNNAPRLTVDAAVVAKRISVSGQQIANAGDSTGAHGYTDVSHTVYYVTFEVDSGDRMELSLSGEEYGQLAEGDRGRLHFQGTRYLGFDRESHTTEE